MRALFAMALLALPLEALSATTLLDRGKTQLTLGGYARSFVAVQKSPIELEEAEEEAGVGAAVLRLEWKLLAGEHVSLEAHQRGYFSLSPGVATVALAGPGLGVSPVPKRTVSLRSAAVDTDELVLEHDLDRLVCRLYFESVDVYLGRQAILWGTSTLFPVADLWNVLSPFEVDTTQRRGIDAIRVLVGLAEKSELELVLGERGSLEELSFGLRAAWYLSSIDLWTGAGKLWDEAMAFAGAAADLGSLKVRGDLVVPYGLVEQVLQWPRATVGLDWVEPDFTFVAELHFNGAGAAPSEPYLEHALTSSQLERGETFLLGRLYAGIAAVYKPVEVISLEASVLGNLIDPSAVVTVQVGYAPTQAAQVTLGVFAGVGQKPLEGPPPSAPSEFGAYGSQLFLDLAAFF